MKRIMISVKPRYVAKILNGEKTLEVRKSAPKEVLKGEECLVEIYCTKDPKHTVAPFKFIEGWCYKEYNDNTSYACGCTANMGETINGQVVARWLLKCCEELENTVLPTIPTCVYLTKTKRYASAVEKASCLSQDEIYTYLSGRDGYAWHIDNLKIYDKPKELSEFGLKRAPQSWCYIN